MKKERRRDEITKLLLQARGLPCAVCGGTDLDTMTLYHVRGEPKRFNLSPSCNRSVRAVYAELLKCDPICLSCSRRRFNPRPWGGLGSTPLTRLLRQQAKNHDAREKRRLKSGRMGIDSNVSGVSPSPYADLDDSDGT